MIQTDTFKKILAQAIKQVEKDKVSPMTDEDIESVVSRIQISFTPSSEDCMDKEKCIVEDLQNLLNKVHDAGGADAYAKKMTEIVEVRPTELVCDVVRFQNNKEKWVALVGLLNGRPYEIFTGLQDDDEGIVLPKTVTRGKIIKHVNEDGSKRYDFQFENRRGYKTTVEGLSEKFNPEYWNYAKLISGVLRYQMPVETVVKLVSSMQMKSESVTTWKNGVERALKKYTSDGSLTEENE